MIRRKLLIATAVIASVVITACSDTTAPKQLAAGGGLEPAIAAQGRYASEDDHARNLFFTTSGGGAEVFAIKVSGKRITTTDIGPTNGGNCVSLALSLRGHCTACADPCSGPSSLRPSIRKLDGQTCSAWLSPGSRSWPWPLPAMGSCTQLGVVALMRISSVPPALIQITTHSTGSMRQPERSPVWVQLAPRNFS